VNEHVLGVFKKEESRERHRKPTWLLWFEYEMSLKGICVEGLVPKAMFRGGALGK
jgi:hypothetical protein